MITKMRHEEPLTWITRGVALTIILVGMALRIGQYLANRSLWLDEALLAQNIANRSLAGLTQPLDHDQGAPVGFLFVQKLTVQALGNEDYILRLIPLAAGVLSLYLVYKVAGYYTTGTAILVALALFAISGPLVYYASEVKQYSSDVAICLLLLLVAAGCFEADGAPKHYVALGVAGALALWFSHPALFVVAGIGLSLALYLLARRDWRMLSWLGGVFVAWSASFVALYVFSLRALAANDTLIRYWGSSFMPMPPWRDPAWLPDAFLNMLEDPAGLSAVSIAMVAFFLGCLSLLLRRWPIAFALILPFALVLLASGLRKYPFSGRLMLFIVPLAFLLIADGIERTRMILLRINPWVSFGAWLILAAALLSAPAAHALQNLRQPQLREHIKPVVSYIAQHKLDEDSIYVYYGAEFLFRYYAPRYGFQEDDYSVGVASRQDPDQYAQELNELSGRGRTWFVFSHVYDWEMIDEEAFFLEQLDRLGTRLDEVKAPGASAYLYDLTAEGQ